MLKHPVRYMTIYDWKDAEGWTAHRATRVSSTSETVTLIWTKEGEKTVTTEISIFLADRLHEAWLDRK